jgi:DNA-binding IclR family transcriptional regulator
MARALELIRAQPGVRTTELATKMEIRSTYLYRILPALEKEGKVTKQGRGWHLAT